MQHVTRTHGGWFYRRSIAGKAHRRFFSDRKYGGKEAALAEAEKLAREIDEQYGEYRGKSTPRLAYSLNRTGIIGVAWSCRADTQNPNNIRHLFRGQATIFADDPDKRRVIQSSFSVSKHGLWSAYKKAAEFRFQVIPDDQIDEDELIHRFLEFLETYIETMRDPAPESKEMEAAFFHLYSDPAVPKALYDQLPSEIELIGHEVAQDRAFPRIRLKPD